MAVAVRPAISARLARACLVMGFTALLAQVVLTRELLGLCYGNELIVALVLAVWLVVVGMGSALGARVERRLRVPERACAWSQLALAALLPAALLLLRRFPPAAPGPGQVLGPGAVLLAALEALMPACLLLGLQFVFAARWASEGQETRGVSVVYALEAAGAVLGGLVFHLLLAQHASHVLTLSLVALGNVVSAWALLRPRAAGAIPLAALAAALLLLALTSRRVELAALRTSPRWQGLNPVATVSSKYGELVVAAQSGQVSFYQSGLLLFTSQDEYANEVAVHLPLLAHADPRAVLLLGGHLPGLVGEALKHPVAQVDGVELDPRVVELAARWLPPAALAPLRDPRVHAHTGDARAFVRSARAQYDVIIVNLPDPTTAALNRFYTVEFLREAQRALKPGGLLAVGVTGSETQLSGPLQLAVATVEHTLAAVFPERLIVPGERTVFLASTGPLTADWRLLAARLSSRGVRASFVNDAWLRDALLPLRSELFEEALREAPRPPLDTDLDPISYYHQTRVWLEQLSPGVAAPLRFLSGFSVWWAFASWALAGAVALVTRGAPRRSASRLFAAATIGGFGLVMEVLALLVFQSACGYLYQALAGLTAAFMAGLAAGAMAAGRRLARREVGDVSLLICLAAAGLTCLLVPALFRLALASPALAPSLLALTLAFAGALVGAAFPILTALYRRDRPASAAGAIYAADLVGSSGAAAVVGVIAVPLVGVAGVSLATGVCCAGALLLAAVARGARP